MNSPAVTPLLVSRPTSRRSYPIHQRPSRRSRGRIPWAARHRLFLLLLAAAVLTCVCGFVSGNSAARAEEAPKKMESAPPAPAYTEQSLPQCGEIRKFTEQECIAPFEIKAAKGSHYLVKLADLTTHAPVMTIFVRGDSTIRVEVPLGTYELKYAAGKQWYGYDHLFGPTTGYSKAEATLNFTKIGNQVSGYSVTLYTVEDGNLRTYPIDRSEF